MGSTHYYPGEFNSHEDAVRHEIEWHRNDEPQRHRIIAKSGRYYAVETIATGEVFAVVALGSKYRDGSVSVKLVDEEMGPAERACPAKILDLLTDPAPSWWAAEWRQDCREAIKRKKTARKAAKVAPGTVIEFEDAIAFTNGYHVTRFRFEGGYKAVALSTEGGHGLFRATLPKDWRAGRKWKVVA